MAQPNVYIMTLHIIDMESNDDYTRRKKYFTSFKEAEKWIFNNTTRSILRWNKGKNYWFPKGEREHQCNVRKNVQYHIISIAREELNPTF